MLVLSRKAGESVKIGDDVVVKVVRIGHGRVQVGIEAPRDTSVVRGELYPRGVGDGAEGDSGEQGKGG